MYVEAYKIMKEFEPNNTKEYMLKGVCLALHGQQKDNKDDLEKAKSLF